jgi:purine nucleosidase
MPATPVILDTDVGTDVDDALALGLLLASPEIDLRAVTVVSGDVALRARIARKILSLGGRADIPVFAGMSEPSCEHRNFLWLGHEGRGIVGDDEPIDINTGNAANVLAGMTTRDPAHVVAIGPLTNIAAALQRAPQLAGAVTHLTLMGGALGIGDDPTTPPLEYNLGSDAEASVAVLTAGIPTTLVPLDVTWQVRFRDKQVERLRRSRSALVQVLCDAMEIWWPVHRDLFEGKRVYGADVFCFLHDPLALSLLIDPTFVTVVPMRLVPEIADGVFRLRRSDQGRAFDVAIKVDAPAFVEFLVDRLLSLK